MRSRVDQSAQVRIAVKSGQVDEMNAIEFGEPEIGDQRGDRMAGTQLVTRSFEVRVNEDVVAGAFGNQTKPRDDERVVVHDDRRP